MTTPRRRTRVLAPAPVAVALPPALGAAALLLAVAAPVPLAAHEDAVLEAPTSTVAAGGELRISGRNFAPGEDHRLRLAGALDAHELVEVTPDSAGTFEMSLRVPGDVDPGRYRLEAVAPDGDVVARLSLTLVPGSPSSAREEGGGAGAQAASGPTRQEATAEEMEIDRSRSGPEWAVIVLLVVASGGLGAGLVRQTA